VAKRICEAYSQQRLAMFFREPIERAYSSFYNSLSANVSRTPEGFHELATIEIAIVRTCGGLYDGDPAVDAAASPPFTACCARVAAAHGQTDWSGCACDMVTNFTPQPHGLNHHKCTFFGSKVASQVRNSIYVIMLEAYFRYHAAQNLLLYEMTDVVRDMPTVVRELALYATTPSLRTPARRQLLAMADLQEHHANVHTYPPMLNETLEMLQDFYRPYNKRLFELIGRSFAW